MKKLLPLFALLFTTSLFAQEFVGVSYGVSYSEMAFYRLTDDATTNLDGDAWDVAFSTMGTTDAGIFINEEAIVFGDERGLFLAPTDNFDDIIDPGDLTERLLNDEKSWDYGAFNEPRDDNDPDDFGWGLYDSSSEVITGNRVFVLRFKNGSYQKMMITSLDQGVYTIKHADLDGSNEVTLTIDKTDFPDHEFAFVSLATGTAVDNIPTDWDLWFTRYSSPVDDLSGGFFNLVTSGVLSSPLIEVAEASGIDPDLAEFADYEDSLSMVPDVIGFDWKAFNNYQWELPEDLTYFIKRPTGQVWKVIFVDFDGSSTGNSIFTKEEVVMTSVREKGAFESFAVYPNPLTASSAAVFTLRKPGTVYTYLTNQLGQPVWNGQQKAQAGLNAVNLNVQDMPPGVYLLTIEFEGERVSKKVVRG